MESLGRGHLTDTVFFIFIREGLGLVNRTANAFEMELVVDQLAQSTEVTATAGKKAKSDSKVSKVPRICRVINFTIN